MENQQQTQYDNTQDENQNKNNLNNEASDNMQDGAYNDTGLGGTTNSVSETRQDKDGYKIAIEDTLIGYDGDDAQLNMDLDDKETKPKNNAGIDDND
jgi:hypothetical protein